MENTLVQQTFEKNYKKQSELCKINRNILGFLQNLDYLCIKNES